MEKWSQANRTLTLSKLCFIAFLVCATVGCSPAAPKPVPATPKVECRHPLKPNEPPQKIHEWKYEAVSRAIMQVMQESPGGVKAAELTGKVKSKLASVDQEEITDLKWSVDTVRGEMECRGEIERISNEKPLTLRLPGATTPNPTPPATSKTPTPQTSTSTPPPSTTTPATVSP
ncbi:MAG: hypothetical protein R3C01_13965 [Planctomycetaceae bacterium]